MVQIKVNLVQLFETMCLKENSFLLLLLTWSNAKKKLKNGVIDPKTTICKFYQHIRSRFEITNVIFCPKCGNQIDTKLFSLFFFKIIFLLFNIFLMFQNDSQPFKYFSLVLILLLMPTLARRPNNRRKPNNIGRNKEEELANWEENH